MPVDILLVGLNARYAHPSLGLRSLRANLGPWRERSALFECDPRLPPDRVAEAVLAREPRVLAIGVYIWNRTTAAETLREVRRRAPGVRILLGGPELDPASLAPFDGLADAILLGEGEEAFPGACRDLLAEGRTSLRVLEAGLPDVDRLVLPDAEYSDHDLATRVTYVESARGCPYRCEYCLSARDRSVRHFPEERVFASLDRLLRRGGRRFKFVDRTFNVDIERAARLLAFWLDRRKPGLSVQFEAVPDRFPSPLRDLLARFPPRLLRLEIGVQTLDPRVADVVGRPLDPAAVEDTFVFLRDRTGVTVHADLIAGLPGETLAGFAKGFDRLVSWQPAEIQVGLLKKLPGASMARHDGPFGMRYRAEPPYEVLAHDALNADEVVRLKRFARFWDRAYNRGRLRRALPLLWRDSGAAFDEFMCFSDWAFERFGRDWGIQGEDLARALADYLQTVRRLSNAQERVRECWEASGGPSH